MAPNPYESPRAEPTPVQQVARAVSLWLAVPLTLLASAVAFVGACFPIGFVGFSIGYHGEATPFAPEGEVTMWLAWIVGAVAAVLAGVLEWRYSRRPASLTRSNRHD